MRPLDASQGPSWLRNPDSLGIGLRQQAEERRRELNPYGLGNVGPLRDPMWDAFLESLDGAGRVQQVGGQFGPLPSTVQPGQTSAAADLPPSTHISNVMGGLTRATMRRGR